MALKKDPANKQKIILIISLIAISSLVLFSLIYTFAKVGKSIAVVPQTEPLNLDIYQSQEIDLNLDKISLRLTPSGEEKTQEYNLTIMKKEDYLKYNLTQGEKSYVGLITNSFSQKIYLDKKDFSPDLELVLGGDYLQVTNLNYKEPDYAKVSITKENLKPLKGDVLPISGQGFPYYFLVGAEFPPEVEAFLEEGKKFAVKESYGDVENFSVSQGYLKETEVVTVFGLEDFSLEEEKPTYLFFKAKVGEKETLKKYLLAPLNITYLSEEENYPQVKIEGVFKEKGGEFILENLKYTIVFKETVTIGGKPAFQAFSLPCGEIKLNSINDEDKEKIDLIKSYEKGEIKQFNPKGPSNFDSLVSHKGYTLKLKEEVLSFTLEGTCKQEQELFTQLELVTLPSLEEGWNLIGIQSYQPIKRSDLTKKTPPGKEVKYVYDIQNKGIETLLGEEEYLKPGRAYWVYVE